MRHRAAESGTTLPRARARLRRCPSSPRASATGSDNRHDSGSAAATRAIPDLRNARAATPLPRKRHSTNRHRRSSPTSRIYRLKNLRPPARRPPRPKYSRRRKGPECGRIPRAAAQGRSTKPAASGPSPWSARGGSKTRGKNEARSAAPDDPTRVGKSGAAIRPRAANRRRSCSRREPPPAPGPHKFSRAARREFDPTQPARCQDLARP